MILVRPSGFGVFTLKSISTLTQGTWHPPSAPLKVRQDLQEETCHLPPETAYFLAVNRNKRSITVNLKDERGVDIIRKLVKSSDVLVENYLPGKLTSMGLGWDDCRGINQRLIYASISGSSSPRCNPCVFCPWVNC